MNVLSGTDISHEVLALIEGAKQVLILISPYFDPWDRLTTEIKRAVLRPNLKIVMLLRGGDDRAKQEEKARDLVQHGVKVGYLTRLHAKVYISESQAIVTSMNLLKSSALDSWEIAMRAHAKEDAQQFQEILQHATALIQRASDEKAIAARAASTSVAAPSAGSSPANTKATKPAAAQQPSATRGSCIRCGTGIPFKVERPLCPECYKAWARYENPDFKEKHCHCCGEGRSTTFARPLCKACWDAQP